MPIIVTESLVLEIYSWNMRVFRAREDYEARPIRSCPGTTVSETPCQAMIGDNYRKQCLNCDRADESRRAAHIIQNEMVKSLVCTCSGGPHGGYTCPNCR